MCVCVCVCVCVCLTWSDILYQLDPLPTDSEAEAQVVLLDHHTPLDQTRAWGRER